MIRQAVSCDICGTEKKQTNHWFVAYDQAGELRMSGWNSRNKLRPGAKHLCGQTCLHKLVDDFLAKDLARAAEERTHLPAPMEAEAPRVSRMAAEARDTSLTSDAAYEDYESSARLISTPAVKPVSKPLTRPLVVRAPVEMPQPAAKLQVEDAEALLEEEPRFTSRNWRAEAWEREREREQQHALPRHSSIASRRRSNG